MVEKLTICSQTWVIWDSSSVTTTPGWGLRCSVIYVIACRWLIYELERRSLMVNILFLEAGYVFIVYSSAIILLLNDAEEIGGEKLWLRYSTLGLNVLTSHMSGLFIKLHLVCDLLFAPWDLILVRESLLKIRWNSRFWAIKIDFVVVPIQLCSVKFPENDPTKLGIALGVTNLVPLNHLLQLLINLNVLCLESSSEVIHVAPSASVVPQCSWEFLLRRILGFQLGACCSCLTPMEFDIVRIDVRLSSITSLSPNFKTPGNISQTTSTATSWCS